MGDSKTGLRPDADPDNYLMWRNKTELRCCSETDFKEWLEGDEHCDGYRGENPKWQFCQEADRTACSRLREAGACIRDREEWNFLLKQDKRANRI